MGGWGRHALGADPHGGEFPDHGRVGHRRWSYCLSGGCLDYIRSGDRHFRIEYSKPSAHRDWLDASRVLQDPTVTRLGVLQHGHHIDVPDDGAVGQELRINLIGYEIPDDPPPIATEMPGMFVPLQQLENLAPSTWYVNVLAVLPQFRNRSHGTQLLRLAEETGHALGKRRSQSPPARWRMISHTSFPGSPA